MTAWIDQLRALAVAQPAAMVTVVATEGSAPRGAGTRMLVTAEALSGTIGGGKLEHRAIEQARSILTHPPGTWRVQDYPLGPLLGQCCGGRVRLLVEHVDPGALGWTEDVAPGLRLVTELGTGGVARWVTGDGTGIVPSARGDLPRAGACWSEVIGRPRRPLYLFGAGHVGQAIALQARHLPLRLAWFDTREAFAAVDGVTLVAEADLSRCVADAPADAAVVILTHDHALDYALVQAALRRSPVAFVGVIGSATKRARFLGRLARDGVDEAARTRLTCPIGIESITGKEPEVIALATLAQLVQLDGGR
ncbi:xanthine dehydrogenase accessory protein XdhC [Sphingomonas sp. S6]|jgi:xanthine dehydrogenase accessory factor|uniref:xanthine dehydrogenase accessory protein XdhC n=1 Tax=Sphingomonas sp. S6 TaxID=3368600 RepID=UPI000FBADF6C|nr:xanthine dehydrogenase accessory protein XdhC [uncultured Sphingomonas sp.]RTL21377.1 MAG: xanthine dehydrogenase accessory protein XdhC [Sphingomonadaceae bacterium]